MVIVWEPNKNPRVVDAYEIDLGLLQSLVRGYIEAPFRYGDYDFFLNEEGRLTQNFLTFYKPWLQLPLPSRLRDCPAAVFGPMVICRHNAVGDSVPLTQEDVNRVIALIPGLFTYEAIQ